MTENRAGSRLGPKALERILEVTRQLAAPLELSVMLGQLIDAARSVLDAERGTVFLYDAAAHELYATVSTGSESIRFPADSGIAGESARSRSVINVPDCYEDPRFNPDVDKRTGYRTRCLLSVPLIGHDDALVGVLQVLNKRDGVFTEEDERVAAALGAQCAVALQRARMLSEIVVKKKMERELEVAREIQARVLPSAVPAVEGYDIAGWSRPADQTGGDIFDFIPLDSRRLLVLVGDATGHGIGPALSVTQVRAMLRIAVRLGADLLSAYAHLNDQLSQDLADNRFVTAFLGVLDAEGHRVTYHSGGQAPILHFQAASGECMRLGASMVPLGYLPNLPMKPAETLELAPGDILALMTDGIYEYAAAGGEMFGEDRAVAVIRDHQQEPMSRLREVLVQRVRAFAGASPQEDDMTIVLVKRLPS